MSQTPHAALPFREGDKRQVDGRPWRYDLSTMITRAIILQAIRRGLAVALVVALGASAAGCGNSEPLCENSVKREAVSPDGVLKAVLFERSCGSTTGFSSQVSILPVAETETRKGNAFIADTAGGLAPAASWGGPDVALEWTSPAALTLAYAPRVRVIIAEPTVRGVAISHRIKD